MKPLNVFLQVIFPGKSVLATVALYSDFLSHFSFFVNALNESSLFEAQPDERADPATFIAHTLEGPRPNLAKRLHPRLAFLTL